ncbi:hypothetical protein DSM112329_05451 [Paraconexibacter sp. AEG42_29]|uniref:Alkaline phosphatase family protein n=1 Tax=Paraconexibacter sp. AEG42_29 TaxID=2997339 RepID=A0AAU7B3G0_9ACTN
MTGRATKKLVLAVIDGLKPSELERAVEAGRAPVLAQLMAAGTYVPTCCAAFPSVTPVCAATIATGRLQDEHRIPAMNWYSRSESRYVEYGSSFPAVRKFGVAQQLIDTVYNMNAEHLPADVETVFETLDDRGLRTAGTTYLMFRGRHEHKPAKETPIAKLTSQVMRRTVKGPTELFYADLYASRDTGCWSRLGMPGLRDQHTGCVGAYMVEHDLFDFLLFSLPDNDTHSHEAGPHMQIESIEAADRQLERLMVAGGGVDAFLREHAVIVVADHSHAPVEQTIAFQEAFARYDVLPPSGRGADRARIALCPSQRSAQLYVLEPDPVARRPLVAQLVATGLATDGIDLALYLDRTRPVQGVIAGAAGELRFRPAGAGAAGAEGGPDAALVRDARGGRWTIEGAREVLGAVVEDGLLVAPSYPDALARVWAALTCPTSGDVLFSAAPEWEFPDWGGQHHIGGGSHGSLHAVDSLGALVYHGVDAPAARVADGAWSIADIAPMVIDHFRGAMARPDPARASPSQAPQVP